MKKGNADQTDNADLRGFYFR